jgi:hypothetical protein
MNEQLPPVETIPSSYGYNVIVAGLGAVYEEKVNKALKILGQQTELYLIMT